MKGNTVTLTQELDGTVSQSIELEVHCHDEAGTEICPNAGWLRGQCGHGNVRWLRLQCKRRGCPVCGQVRKRLIAWRVRHGIQILGRAAWFVGTWDYDVDKATAVQTQNKFIRWLRRDCKLPVQYAAVWEKTKAGRLHLNLVLAPWPHIDQAVLSRKWQDFGGGPVVWIERVEAGIEAEVTKLQRKFGNYLAKFEQMVETGRGINYSRDWPKLPENVLSREGAIDWSWHSEMSDAGWEFRRRKEIGMYHEVSPGEYERSFKQFICRCFEFRDNKEVCPGSMKEVCHGEVVEAVTEFLKEVRA